jgi:hypothetical protein
MSLAEKETRSLKNQVLHLLRSKLIEEGELLTNNNKSIQNESN